MTPGTWDWQVGAISLDEDGIARKGMLIRHLVLPEGLSGTGESLKFIADHMGPGAWVSLMNQYFPAHKGLHTPPLQRKVTREEYEDALQVLADLNLENGFVQDACEDEPVC